MSDFENLENQKDFSEFVKNDDYILESLACKTNNKDKMRLYYLKELGLWVRAILLVILAVILIRGFIGEPVEVLGTSMLNTLETGDILIMNKIGPLIKKPAHGDIIVIEIEPVHFKHFTFLNDIVWFRRIFPAKTREDYIKRIVAVEFDTVDMIDGYLYVNDKLIDEPYIRQDGVTYERNIKMPYEVPAGHVFVLGDNRASSRDSRSIGAISYEEIIGKVIFRVLPLRKMGPTS